MTNRTFGIEGFPDQRTSATRVYTHALLGRRDAAADHARDIERARVNAKDLWDYLQTEDSRDRGYRWNNQEERDRLDNAIRAMSLEAYVAKVVAEVAPPAQRGLGVIQWSSSERAALNAVGSWRNRGWLEVKVVPAFETKRNRNAPSSVGAIYK